MALNTGLRTSSNMVIAGGITNALIDLVQAFYPDFMVSPEMRTYVTLAICWIVARVTKTPDVPKVL